jgi:hypothetical protein
MFIVDCLGSSRERRGIETIKGQGIKSAPRNIQLPPKVRGVASLASEIYYMGKVEYTKAQYVLDNQIALSRMLACLLEAI